MSNLLRIEFLGLTGLVPNRKCIKEPVSSILAVLPDLKRRLEHDDLAHVPALHVPAVIVPTDSVISESGKHQALQFQNKQGRFSSRDYSLYLFDNEHLSFEGLSNERLDCDLSRVQSGDVPKDPGEEQALKWVPQMSLANDTDPKRGVGAFKASEFLNSDLTPKRKDGLAVVGCASIESGRMFVRNVITYEGEPVLYDFCKPEALGDKCGNCDGEAGPVEWSQAMFSEIVCDSNMIRSSVELVFQSPEGIRSTISVSAIGGMCPIWIVNLELSSLIPLGRRTPPLEGYDYDYGIFYLFSEGTEKAKNLPVPIPHDPMSGGGDSLCRPPRFDFLA